MELGASWDNGRCPCPWQWLGIDYFLWFLPTQPFCDSMNQKKIQVLLKSLGLAEDTEINIVAISVEVLCDAKR